MTIREDMRKNLIGKQVIMVDNNPFGEQCKIAYIQGFNQFTNCISEEDCKIEYFPIVNCEGLELMCFGILLPLKEETIKLINNLTKKEIWSIFQLFVNFKDEIQTACEKE